MTFAAPGSLSAFALLGGFTGAPGVVRAPVLPNPRRTITLKTANWLDTFPDMSTDEEDALTFDLVRLLQDDERIASIDGFDLVLLGPSGVSDPSPSSRLAGIASIAGTQVSQRFGNWQASVPWIKYLVVAKVTTTRDGPILVKGYLSVRQLLH